jgi:hypothetical protein
MAKIRVDIDDRLLGLAAEQLGTASPKDTIEAALLAVTGPPSEDAADIADADAAMQEPEELIALGQAEIELAQPDASDVAHPGVPPGGVGPAAPRNERRHACRPR